MDRSDLKKILIGTTISVAASAVSAMLKSEFWLPFFLGGMTAMMAWLYWGQRQKNLSLQGKIDNFTKDTRRSRLLGECIMSIIRDVPRDSYDYEYSSVHHACQIDGRGNYNGIYVHKALNSSGRALGEYIFVLRFASPARFKDLAAKARVRINEEPEATVTPLSKLESPAMDVQQAIRVPFPRAINRGDEFHVTLQFLWPNGLMLGQEDGAIFDLCRFRKVDKAVFDLQYEGTVDNVGWYWLNPTNGLWELFPSQPEPIEEKKHFTLEVRPCNDLNLKTVYTFSGIFSATAA